MKRTFVLILIVAVMSGCGGIVESTVDPDGYTARTQAKEKTAQDDAFARSQQWLAEQEKARADAADADGRAREKEADADIEKAKTDAAKATAAAFEAMGEQITNAANANKNLVLIAILLIVGFAAFAIWNMRRVTTVTMEALVNRPPLQLPAPPQVILIAQRENLTPVQVDGRWLMLDEDGNVKKRQKILA